MIGSIIRKLGLQYEGRLEGIVTNILSKIDGDVYLDCGCDDGEKTVQRAKVLNAKKIIGIEVEPSRYKKAQKRGIKIYPDDLNKVWSIRSGSVDAMTATDMIEHIIDVDNFLKEAKRILKPGGDILISTENLAAWHNILALLIGNQPYTGPYVSRKFPIGHRPNAKYYSNKMNETMYPHLNVMTAKALNQLLRHWGFTIESSQAVGFYPLPYPLAGLFARFDPIHSSYIVVHAKKN